MSQRQSCAVELRQLRYQQYLWLDIMDQLLSYLTAQDSLEKINTAINQLHAATLNQYQLEESIIKQINDPIIISQQNIQREVITIIFSFNQQVNNPNYQYFAQSLAQLKKRFIQTMSHQERF